MNNETSEMDLYKIDEKLMGDWADWDDKPDGCLRICKSELIRALKRIEGEIMRYEMRVTEGNLDMDATCNLCRARYVNPEGEGSEQICYICLRDMKTQLLKLSRLLSDKDLRAVYIDPVTDKTGPRYRQIIG